MPKYLLLKYYRGGPEPHRRVPPMDQWAPEDVEAHAGHAARGPLPRSPPAPAGCVPLDGLPAPRADRRLGNRRRRGAPPAAVAGPPGPFAGLAVV
jgi:hypothetical protein